MMTRFRKKSSLLPTNRLVPIASIKPHAENYNYHSKQQLGQLGKSLADLGQFRSVVLWEQEDGSLVQLAGHGVVEAMRSRGDESVRADVFPVSLDALTAKRIMLADNEHARNSEPDVEIFARLVEEQLDAGIDLDVIGTSEEALRAMLEEISESVENVEKMPTPGDAPVSEISDQWALLITCQNEEEQLELLERFQKEGLQCRVLIS